MKFSLADSHNNDTVFFFIQVAICYRYCANVSFILQFLGALLDNSREVRCAERKILKIVKLNNLAMFKSSIDRLLENLDCYAQVLLRTIFQLSFISLKDVKSHVKF